jgi:hypothetical protein
MLQHVVQNLEVHHLSSRRSSSRHAQTQPGLRIILPTDDTATTAHDRVRIRCCPADLLGTLIIARDVRAPSTASTASMLDDRPSRQEVASRREGDQGQTARSRFTAGDKRAMAQARRLRHAMLRSLTVRELRQATPPSADIQFGACIRTLKFMDAAANSNSTA